MVVDAHPLKGAFESDGEPVSIFTASSMKNLDEPQATCAAGVARSELIGTIPEVNALAQRGLTTALGAMVTDGVTVIGITTFRGASSLTVRPS
jgi:hypothetical protein